MYHLSDKCQFLLTYLTRDGEVRNRAAAQRPGGNLWFVVPHTGFDWNSKIQTPMIEYPECLEELARHGFLQFDKENRTYTLTDKGKKSFPSRKKRGF
jgi:hypothetical protein